MRTQIQTGREKAERPLANLWVLSALVLTVTQVIRGN